MAEQIKNLGQGGINTDLPPMIVPLNTFTDGLNVRFDDDSVQTMTGETTYQQVSNSPDFGVHWRRPDQGFNIFIKGGHILRYNSAGGSSQMFNGGSGYGTSRWQSTIFNGGFGVVVNDGVHTPLYCLYGDLVAGNTFQPLPNWNYVEGLTIAAKVIRSVNYTLVAANLTITEGITVTNAPGTIRVSAQAATGSIPQVWQPGPTTDTADEFELSSTSPIMDMMDLRGNMFIYSQNSISVLSIGSVNRVSPYSSSYGILGTDCVIEFDGKHFVVDRNDIYAHNGSGSIESLADFRIKKYFFSNLNKAESRKVHVVKNPFFKEIWINYPKGSSVVCNEALVFNYKNNTWSKRQLTNVTYMFNGPAVLNSEFEYAKESIYITTNGVQTLVTDSGYLMWNGSALVAYESFVTKKKMNTGDTSGSALMSALYPVFDNVPLNTPINIYVVGQNNYTDDVAFTSNDLFVFEPNNKKSQGYKVDPRVSGRIMNYKVTSMGYWRMPLYSIDVKQMDRR